jgi:hypothetical protein
MIVWAAQNQLAKAIGMSPKLVAEDEKPICRSWPIAWNRIDLIFWRQDRVAGNRNAGYVLALSIGTGVSAEEAGVVYAMIRFVVSHGEAIGEGLESLDHQSGAFR